MRTLVRGMAPDEVVGVVDDIVMDSHCQSSPMQSTGARFHVHKIRKCESTEGRYMKRRLVDATPCSRLPPDPDVDDDDDGQSSSSSAAVVVLQLIQVKPLPSCTHQKARSNFSRQEIAQGIKGFAHLRTSARSFSSSTSLRCPRALVPPKTFEDVNLVKLAIYGTSNPGAYTHMFEQRQCEQMTLDQVIRHCLREDDALSGIVHMAHR